MAKKRLDHGAMRDGIARHGVEGVVRTVVDGMNNGELDLDHVSIQGLYLACHGGDLSGLARAAHTRESYIRRGVRTTEEVRSNAFTFATGMLIRNKMIEAYNARPSQLDKLVTKVPSSMRMEPMQGFQAMAGLQDVPEGAEYEDNKILERVTMNPEPIKRGRRIAITYETVLYDQTGQILKRATDLGILLKDDREYYGFNQIQDSTGFKCYYPVAAPNQTSAQVDLYRTSAGTNWYDRTINAKTGNALTDWTNVDAAQQVFDGMTDEANRPLVVTGNTLLIPRALLGTGARLVNSTMMRQATDTANRQTYSDAQGAMSIMLDGGQMNLVWSPFLTSTSDWFYGDPKRQFIEREIIPPQVLEIPPDERRDIVAEFRCRRKGQVEATDDKYFVRSST